MHKRILHKLALATACLFLYSCSSSPSQTPDEWIGFRETGIASFYSNRYQFRRTASGERFNQLARTAAHKEIPFGARVRVTNVSNGESVVVRINDRGPFVEGRIIDLTRSAFGQIAPTRQGLVAVEIEVID